MITADTSTEHKITFPTADNEIVHWNKYSGDKLALAISEVAKQSHAPVLVITPETAISNQLHDALYFFSQGSSLPLLHFPDWETLPYDHFSPHLDLVSSRLEALYRLPRLQEGIILVSINTLMQRLPPRSYLEQNTLIMQTGDQLDIDAFRQRLIANGYRLVSQVYEHGEFAVRGSIMDIFPMGSHRPFRIDLFDNEVESLREFDPDNQLSTTTLTQIKLMPAREYPLNDESITSFRQHWRARFAGDPTQCPIYEGISSGEHAAGVEYYLPLFYQQTDTLFDFLSEKSILIKHPALESKADQYWNEINHRYEQLRHDITKPILPPQDIFIPTNQVFQQCKAFRQIDVKQTQVQTLELTIDHKAEQPLHKLAAFIQTYQGRILFCAETIGRRDVLQALLSNIDCQPEWADSWEVFIKGKQRLALTVTPLEHGLQQDQPLITVISEAQLLGQQVMQRRLRKRRGQDPDTVVRNLTELKTGDPVVHVDYGVGRYLGLKTLTTNKETAEYLHLSYAEGDTLYVPVSSLQLISRYSGADIEHAPLHSLGSKTWERAKRKAAEKIYDVAVELLDIYSQRASQAGFQFPSPDAAYQNFASAFAFETTPDQQDAIDRTLEDMQTDKPMDRLVCGDVGFGKTEVAMRAAFVAVQANKQVAILTPTTLLAQQHGQTFQDRFADWPIRVESISRFKTANEQHTILEDLAAGKVDIIIGTHKLIQPDVKFKALGLLVVDEEQRFGVKQKERIKAMRSHIDILTLTATPIPRTLNLSMAGIRDLSIIATPPQRRLAVKTFVQERNDYMIREAVLREILRGGQVYFIHNEVKTIHAMADALQKLIPEAQIGIGHGQMRERELEKVMRDFYHHRFNLLLATTIIENGIDIPTANTIIINKANKFGLAQLHQLRGRVGRSHHQAYAYLLSPPKKSLTSDAKKRLEAIASLEQLGAGYALAAHDLEIRGAGDILGEGQSGHFHEIGFELYMELLDQTIKKLKRGETLDYNQPLHDDLDVNLHVSALIPETQVPDVHTRLTLYKRIANATTQAELRERRVELIDRFGLLPPETKNLFDINALKIKAKPLGIKRIDAGSKACRVEFNANPSIKVDALIKLIQSKPDQYKFDGNTKLRVMMESTDLDAKLNLLNNLIETLHP